jgi:hypothetical protein
VQTLPCPVSCPQTSILVIFASRQLQILLISIRSTDEQFCRMGSLAWLGYLSYTQVVESSNLSPSIIYCSASFLAIHLAETSQKIVFPIQDTKKETERDARLIINLADYLPYLANLSITLPIHFVVLFNRSILANSFGEWMRANM